MATIADAGFPNLMNVIKRMRPDGSIEQQMADTLSKELPLLDDIPWREGNLPTGDLVTAKLGLPSPTWRKLNQGLDPVKLTTNQYTESCGLLEAYSKVDIAVAELNGNTAAYRASEDKGFVEGIAQELSRALWYESTLTSPEKIHGLAPRYPATTGYTASSYVQIGTNAGVNCESVWCITWDPDKIFGIYPKGSVMGLEHKDMGEQLVLDSNSKQFRALVSHYRWKCGLEVKDYRYAVRLQWDPDDSNFADSGKSLYVGIENALNTLYKTSAATRIYMSRTSRKKLGAQLTSNDARFLDTMNKGAGLVETFLGFPLRVSDSLVAETALA